jgi:hypothetical protein
MGMTEIDDALLRLDSFTKEEGLMAAAKSLEVTCDIKVLAEDIDENVKAVKERT